MYWYEYNIIILDTTVCSPTYPVDRPRARRASAEEVECQPKTDQAETHRQDHFVTKIQATRATY